MIVLMIIFIMIIMIDVLLLAVILRMKVTLPTQHVVFVAVAQN